MEKTIEKICINCKHWQDIHKQQEVLFCGNEVIRRIGICLIEQDKRQNLMTESYFCNKFIEKEG